MSGVQGKRLHPETRQLILKLLADPELSIASIASRAGVVPCTVRGIHRLYFTDDLKARRHAQNMSRIV